MWQVLLLIVLKFCNFLNWRSQQGKISKPFLMLIYYRCDHGCWYSLFLSIAILLMLMWQVAQLRGLKNFIFLNWRSWQGKKCKPFLMLICFRCDHGCWYSWFLWISGQVPWSRTYHEGITQLYLYIKNKRY